MGINSSDHPRTKIKKTKIPVIYLDSCILIELSKYEQGKCTDVHAESIGKLYNTLVPLIRENRILCPLGNQMCETAVSQQRKQMRDFLYRFTNSAMLEPSEIENVQLDYGYKSFVNNVPILEFNAEEIFIQRSLVSDTSMEVNSSPIYTKEKLEILKQEKTKLMMELNALKNTGDILSFDLRLRIELASDSEVLIYILEHCNDSESLYNLAQDKLIEVYRRVGINITEEPFQNCIQRIGVYNDFLLSFHHHLLPYVLIKSILFTHLMQRPNKIIQSDYLDIKWASAYLPFVSYAITDRNFCSLLNQSGLSDKYCTKVYDIRSIDRLLEDLK